MSDSLSINSNYIFKKLDHEIYVYDKLGNNLGNLSAVISSEAPWLNTTKSGVAVPYAKRIKLTLDGSKIEEDLTDFPVLVKLSDESGILNTDVTDVFNDLDTGLHVDPYTKLLLHMDDEGLTDSSPAPKAVTKYGNVTRSSTQSKFGGYSAYFDGSGDYLEMSDSADFAFGGVDFTIDVWACPTYWPGTGWPAIIGQRTSYSNNNSFSIAFSCTGTSLLVQYSFNGSTITDMTGSFTFSLYTWYHIAFIRSATNLILCVNGNVIKTQAISGSLYDSSAPIKVGAFDGGTPWPGSYFSGYIDELRVSKGIARWTSNFTPPNQAYYTAINDAKKLAITSSDGETQQYVEVESWDATNKEAWLWTKCPTLASGVNTDLYLYYDKDAADNDTYVGEAGSTAASNVWDYNFVGVWHMSQSPNGDATNAIKDSTTNANHLTPVGSMTDADLVDASPGKGIEFDGSNDRADKSSAAALPSSTLTYEIVAVAEPLAAVPSTGMAVVNSSSASNFISLQAYNGHVRSVQDGVLTLSGTTLLAEGVTFYAAFTRLADDERYIFTNGGNKTGNTVSMAYPSSTDRISVGGAGDLTTSYFPGVITEVRISDVVRSDAWIKSTYYSNWDDLVYFYSPAIAPTYVFEGVVSYNEATLSGVQVRLYRRSTGELIDSSSTSASGTFYLSTPFDSEDHYVIALRDYSSINAIIADWVNSSNE